MNQKELKHQVIKVLTRGPNKILVDKTGRSVTVQQAKRMEVYADVIFIRKDGWSIGAPLTLEKEALELWNDEWICMTKYPWMVIKPLNQGYKESLVSQPKQNDEFLENEITT